MANLVYNEAKLSMWNGNIVLASDTIKAMLVTSTYSPNQDDSFIDAGGASDPVDARVAGTTDQTLGSKTQVKDNTNDFAYFDAADVTFSAVAAGATVAGVLVYKDTGTPTTSKNIAYFDITDIPTNGGDITIQWAAVGSGAVIKLA
jgi:hypothetical protein